MAKKKGYNFFQIISASLLIALFAFSITPVALLHDAITNHKDVCYHHFEQKEKSISKADINCHCFDFVADVHFLASFQLALTKQSLFLSGDKIPFYTSHFFSQPHFFAELRGPPSNL